MAATAREQYLVFARKWRPQTFDDVVGQAHITRTLQNALTSGRIGHAFLFVGSRGIGKTTTARILAKALNCLSVETPTPTPCGTCENCRSISDGSNMDVIEIDGASNNTVDDVREIREHVRLMPSRSRYKVYIIDEVHQLSMAAFNALLKTLEEPPAHAMFILATTEAHKVPATIISRCQRFDFRRVAMADICVLLRAILDKEGVKCSEEALQAIARSAEGGIRDAESILDQLVSYCDGEIRFEDVFDVLGLVDWRVMHQICDAILERDIARQLSLVEDIVAAGKDLSQFVQDILQYFRNLLVCKTGDAKVLLALPDDEIARMRAHADRFTLTNLIRLVEQFAELTQKFDSQIAQRIALEAMLIRISKCAVEVSVDTIIEKLLQLAEGNSFSSIPAAAPAEPMESFIPDEENGTATPSRVVLTNANLAEVWPRIAAAAAKGMMSLGVGLGQARPVHVQGDAVVLRFTRQTANARELVEKPEHRHALEQALVAVTENVRTFRCDVADEAAPAPEAGKESAAGVRAPAGHRVPAEEVQAVMKDPHVAKVIDTFRGRIVDVKHDASAPNEG